MVHLTFILFELERKRMDIPADDFDKSQTGSRTIALYERGNLS